MLKVFELQLQVGILMLKDHIVKHLLEHHTQKDIIQLLQVIVLMLKDLEQEQSEHIHTQKEMPQLLQVQVLMLKEMVHLL